MSMRALLVRFLLGLTMLPASPGWGDDVSAQVRFGIFTPLGGTSWEDVVRTWKEAEALGFDSVWVNDHLVSTPPVGEDETQLEGWTALAALATQTTRIRIGVLVTGNTYRNPALLAKMATTVDHISRGRLTLGIGAGWFEREHEAYGFEFGTAKQRAQRLEESLQVITRLWAGGRSSFRGEYYSLDDAPYAPRNVQQPRPPIVVGGSGKKWIIPLVGRYADGWNANETVTPDDFREGLEIIRTECARVGRSSCPTNASKMLHLVAITRVPLAGPVIRFGARFVVGSRATVSLLAGSPAGIADQIREYVDAGANGIIITLLPPYDLESLRTIANEIVPLVRASATVR